MEYPPYNPSSSNSSMPPRAATTSSSASVSTPVPYSSSDYGGGRHVSYGSNYSGTDYNQQSYMTGGNPYPNQPYYQSQNNSATLNQLLQPNSNFSRGCQQPYNAQSYGYDSYTSNWNQFNRNHTVPPEGGHNAYPNFSMSHNTMPMTSHRYSESGNTYDGRVSQSYPSAFTNTSISDSQSGIQHGPAMSAGYGNTSWSGGGGEPSTTPSVPANPHQPLTEPVSPAPAPRANDALERSETNASGEKGDTPTSTSSSSTPLPPSSSGSQPTSANMSVTTSTATSTGPTTSTAASTMVSPSPHPSSRSTTPAAASSPMPRPPSSGRPPSNQSGGLPSNSGMMAVSTTVSGGQPTPVQGAYPNMPARSGMMPHYQGKPGYGAMGPHAHPSYGAPGYSHPGQHMMTRPPHPGAQQMGPYPPTQHSSHPATSDVPSSIPASMPGPANYVHAPNYSAPHHSHHGSQGPPQSQPVGPPTSYPHHLQTPPQQPPQQPQQQPPQQQPQQQQAPPQQPQMQQQMMPGVQPNPGSQMLQGGMYNPSSNFPMTSEQYRQHPSAPRRTLMPPSASGGVPPYGMHPSNMPMHLQGHPHGPNKNDSSTPKPSEGKEVTSDGSMCGTPSAQPMSVGSTGSAGPDTSKEHSNSVSMGAQSASNSSVIYTNTNSNDGVRSKMSSGSTPKAESHPPTPASMHMPSPSQVSNMSSYHDDVDSNSMLSSPGVQSVQQQQHMGSNMIPPPTPIHPVQPPVSSSTHASSSSMNNVRMKMVALGTEPLRPQWVEHYLKFMEEIGRPVTGLPMVSKQTLDLYKFYVAVRERGGLLEVAKNKRWKDVSIAININASASAAYTLRRNYVKYLLDYECRYDRGGIDPRPIIQQVDSMSSKKKKSANANQNATATPTPTSVPPPADYHASHGPSYTHPSHPHMAPHHAVGSHPGFIQQNGTPQQPRYPVPPPQHHPPVYPNGHPTSILPPPRGPSPLPTHYGAPPGGAAPSSNTPGAWRHPYPHTNQQMSQQGMQPHHMMPGAHQTSMAPGQQTVNGPTHPNSGYSQPSMGSQSNVASNIPQSSYQPHQSLPQGYGQASQASHQPGQSSTSASQYGNGPPPSSSVPAQHGGMQPMPPGYRTNMPPMPPMPPHSSNAVSNNSTDIQQPFHPSQNAIPASNAQGPSQQPPPPPPLPPPSSANQLVNSHQAPQYAVSNSHLGVNQSSQNSMMSGPGPQGPQMSQQPQGEQQPTQQSSQMQPQPQQQSQHPTQPQTQSQPPMQSQPQALPPQQGQLPQPQQPPSQSQQQPPQQHPMPPHQSLPPSVTSAGAPPPPPQTAQHQISQLQQLVRSQFTNSNANGSSANSGASMTYRPSQSPVVNYHQHHQQQQPPQHPPPQPHHGSKPPQALIQMLSNSDSSSRRDWQSSSNQSSSMTMANANMVHHHAQISGGQQRMYGSQPQSNMTGQVGAAGMGRHPPGVPVSVGMPPPPPVSHMGNQAVPPPPPPPPPPPQGVMSGTEIMPPPHAQHHPLANSSAKHSSAMYMYKMAPPRVEAPLFPPNCVESTQPKYIKRRKYTHKEIAPVNAWKMLMALKSGLPTEIAWGLDCLNILLYDETTFPYFGLMHLPGLLEVLVTVWRHDLSEVFDMKFGSAERSPDKRSSTNEESKPLHNKSLIRENGITNVSVPSSKEEWIAWFRSLTREDVISRVKRLSRQERNYTYYTRDGVSVKLVENGHTRANLKKLLNQLVTTLETGEEKAGCEVKACLPISPDDVDYIAPMMESGKSEEKLRSYFLPALTRKKEKLTGKGETGATTEGNAAVTAASRLKRQSKLVAVAASSSVVDSSASNVRRCMCGASGNIDAGESRFAEEDGEDADGSGERAHVCLCKRSENSNSDQPPRSRESLRDPDSNTTEKMDEPSCKRIKLEPPENDDETNDTVMADDEISDDECEDVPVPVKLAVVDELICSNSCVGSVHESLFSNVNESEEIQLQRCLVVSNIIRNLSFLSVNERELVAHMGVLRVLGRLLLLGHEHPTKGEWSDSEKLNSKCWRKRWWVESIRENVLVTLVNIAGVLQMGQLAENVVRPILEGILHILVCPASDNTDPFPGHTHMSPQRLALEIMVRFTVHIENVDLIMATLPPLHTTSSSHDSFSIVPTLESVLESLCELLVRPDQIIREMALSVISYMVRAGEGTAAVVLTRCKPSPIMSLVDFVEAIESNAARIVSSGGGVPALRRNPDIMGTSLDMLRRAARILNDLSRVDDNLSLFVDYQERLLTLSMSLVLDQYVAHMLMGVLFNLQEWTKTQANSDASNTTFPKR